MLAGGLVLACFVAVAEIAVNIGKGKQEAKSTENDEVSKQFCLLKLSRIHM